MTPPFVRDFTVRGYEVDASRTTPLPVLLSFLEQLRWEWMSEPDWGLVDGLHAGHFFVVRHQAIELVERPRFGETVTVAGVIESVGRSRIIVRHHLLLGARPIGHARVTGVWIGPNRRLARIPDAARAIGRAQAGTLGPLPPLPHPLAPPTAPTRSFLDAPRRCFAPRGLALALPEASADVHLDSVEVRPSDCDVFGHVNASTWLRYCDDARRRAGVDGVANRAVVDYGAEALAGDALDLRWHPTPDGLAFQISRDGDVIASAALGIQATP